MDSSSLESWRGGVPPADYYLFFPFTCWDVVQSVGQGLLDGQQDIAGLGRSVIQGQANKNAANELRLGLIFTAGA